MRRSSPSRHDLVEPPPPHTTRWSCTRSGEQTGCVAAAEERRGEVHHVVDRPVGVMKRAGDAGSALDQQLEYTVGSEPSSTAPGSRRDISMHGCTRAPAGAVPSTTRRGSVTPSDEWSGTVSTHRQRRVVGPDRPGPDEDGVGLGPESMGIGASLGTGDPLRSIRRGPRFGHRACRQLEHDVRSPGRADGAGTPPELFGNGARRQCRHGSIPASSEPAQPGSGHLGIGIVDGRPPPEPRRRRSAPRCMGRSGPGVTARFERGVDRAPSQRRPAASSALDLGMAAAAEARSPRRRLDPSVATTTPPPRDSGAVVPCRRADVRDGPQHQRLVTTADGTSPLTAWPGLQVGWGSALSTKSRTACGTTSITASSTRRTLGGTRRVEDECVSSVPATPRLTAGRAD